MDLKTKWKLATMADKSNKRRRKKKKNKTDLKKKIERRKKTKRNFLERIKDVKIF